MDPFVDGFAIVRARFGSTIRLVVSGDLDIATAPQLRECYATEHRNGAELIVLDLAAVTFVDSSGLHALLAAHDTDPARLRIILSPVAAHVVDASGLRGVLPIIEG